MSREFPRKRRDSVHPASGKRLRDQKFPIHHCRSQLGNQSGSVFWRFDSVLPVSTTEQVQTFRKERRSGQQVRQGALFQLFMKYFRCGIEFLPLRFTSQRLQLFRGSVLRGGTGPIGIVWDAATAPVLSKASADCPCAEGMV